MALSATACSVVLDFKECNVDEDCAGRRRPEGPAMYCTSDNLCIEGVPYERLCADGELGAPSGPDTTMIAGIFRLTGDAGSKDTEMANAARLAMEEISQLGQRPIGMVLCDSGGDTDQALRALQKAIDRYHIVGAVGPTTSGEMLHVAQAAIDSGVVLISASATNPAIRDLADSGLIWRTAANDELQAQRLAEIIPLTVGMPERSTIVNTAFAGTPYGRGLNNAFVGAWSTRTGSPPVSANEYDESGDIATMLVKLGEDTPDYSMIVADSAAAKVTETLFQTAFSGLSATQFLFTDGAKSPALIGSGPYNEQVLARIRGTAPATPSGPVFNAFKLSYQSKFGSDPGATAFVANTYDATYALALAVAGVRAGEVVSGAAVADGLRRMSSVSSGVAVEVGPNDFVRGAATLGGGGDLDLVGTSGPLTWDPATGDLIEAPLEVWGIDTTSNPPKFCTFDAALTLCR